MVQVAVRAFFPMWVFLYVIQFVLWPVIARDNLVSGFFGNTIYLVAMGYYSIITFLGYNGMWTYRLLFTMVVSERAIPSIPWLIQLTYEVPL